MLKKMLNPSLSKPINPYTEISSMWQVHYVSALTSLSNFDSIITFLKKYPSKNFYGYYYSPGIVLLDNLLYLLKTLYRISSYQQQLGNIRQVKLLLDYYQRELSDHPLLNEEMVTTYGDDKDYKYSQYDETNIAINIMMDIVKWKKKLADKSSELKQNLNINENNLNKPSVNNNESKKDININNFITKIDNNYINNSYFNVYSSYFFFFKACEAIDKLLPAVENGLKELKTLQARGDKDSMKSLADKAWTMLGLWQKVANDILQSFNDDNNITLSSYPGIPIPIFDNRAIIRFIYSYRVFTANMAKIIVISDKLSGYHFESLKNITDDQFVKLEKIISGINNDAIKKMNNFQENNQCINSIKVAVNSSGQATLKNNNFHLVVKELTSWGKRYEDLMVSLWRRECNLVVKSQDNSLTQINIKFIYSMIDHYHEFSFQTLRPILGNIDKNSHQSKVLTRLKNKLDTDYHQLKSIILDEYVAFEINEIKKDLEEDYIINKIKQYLKQSILGSIDKNSHQSKVLTRLKNKLDTDHQLKSITLDEYVAFEINEIKKDLEEDHSIDKIKQYLKTIKKLSKIVFENSSEITDNTQQQLWHIWEKLDMIARIQSHSVEKYCQRQQDNWNSTSAQQKISLHGEKLFLMKLLVKWLATGKMTFQFFKQFNDIIQYENEKNESSIEKFKESDELLVANNQKKSVSLTTQLLDSVSNKAGQTKMFKFKYSLWSDAEFLTNKTITILKSELNPKRQPKNHSGYGPNFTYF